MQTDATERGEKLGIECVRKKTTELLAGGAKSPLVCGTFEALLQMVHAQSEAR